MTFLEIYTAVLDRLRMEATDVETTIENQLKRSINQAYRIVSKQTKRLVTDYLPVINGVVDLPTNVAGAIQFDPILSATTDRIVGDQIKTNREDGTLFTLTYYATPSDLKADTDIPDIPERYYDALISYPCYVYFLSKKRIDLAREHKADFNEALGEGELIDESQQFIQNAYPIF